jgi:hypothetical protein
MMNQLISVVSERTGLSQDQAQTAVEAVIGFLRTKLPIQLTGVLDGLAGADETSAGDGNGGESSDSFMNQAGTLLGNLLKKDS